MPHDDSHYTRYLHDGWTPGKRIAFLGRLRLTQCVKETCDFVGLTTTSAYRAKRGVPEFAEAWEQVLAFSKVALEQAAFSRAVDGGLEPVWYGGKVVGERRVFSEGLLKTLLLREDRRQEQRCIAMPSVATDPELEEALLLRLDRIAAHSATREAALVPDPDDGAGEDANAADEGSSADLDVGATDGGPR